MSYESIQADRYPIDHELSDAATLGPEAAHLAQVYLQTPRALVWHNASNDWPLLVVVLPMATRLAMLTNPIFAHLTRDWGLNVRFIGVDHAHRIFDFRKLLTDDILRKLVFALDKVSTQSTEQHTNATLDLLFSALSKGMLTMLETRRTNWPDHLARQHRLEPNVVGTLFDRSSRFSDFIRMLQDALKAKIIDPTFYGRALRAYDLREESVERRLAHIIQSTLDPQVIERLKQSSVGQHLGCYNWMAIDPNRAGHRHYMLQRLGCFAQFFCDSLLERTEPLESSTEIAFENTPQSESWQAPPPSTALLRLSHAVDSGQDRKVIEALALRFGIDANTVRNLWRVAPAALGTPPTWHLKQILRRLDAMDARQWPTTPDAWLNLKNTVTD